MLHIFQILSRFARHCPDWLAEVWSLRHSVWTAAAGSPVISHLFVNGLEGLFWNGLQEEPGADVSHMPRTWSSALDWSAEGPQYVGLLSLHVPGQPCVPFHTETVQDYEGGEWIHWSSETPTRLVDRLQYSSQFLICTPGEWDTRWGVTDSDVRN